MSAALRRNLHENTVGQFSFHEMNHPALHETPDPSFFVLIPDRPWTISSARRTLSRSAIHRLIRQPIRMPVLFPQHVLNLE